MDESLRAILALLKQDGPVNMKTDWFELTDARLQVSPYTKPHFEMAVASTVLSRRSPDGRHLWDGHAQHRRLPARRDAPTSRGQWTEVEQIAEREGQVVDRNKWRLVIPMYIAETREQAFEECREGWRAWQIDYFRDTLQAVLPGTAETPEGAVETGGANHRQPRRRDQGESRILQENSGGFGGLMMLAHEWGQPRRHSQVLRALRPLRRATLPGSVGLGGGYPAVGRLRRRRRLLQPQRRPRQGLQGRPARTSPTSSRPPPKQPPTRACSPR